MPRPSYIQVKLSSKTHEKVQTLINAINQKRMQSGMVRTNRDLVGISTIMSDFFEAGMASDELETFAHRQYSPTENTVHHD